MKTGATVLVSTAVFLLLAAAPHRALAAPDLMVYPTRVVMSDRVRTAQVDIINTSQTQASYKISLVRKRMTETGEFKDVVSPEPGERFADDMVKYSPRQVTLLPGAGQTIRVMFKPPADLGEGEYRSHLVFAKVPAAVTEVPEQKEQDAKTLTLKISANIGVSIPVIARRGELKAQASIDPASVALNAAETRQQVSFILARTGTRSVYGDVAVYRGKEKVAASDGLAVYTPNSQRKVSLNVLDQYRLAAGESIRVVFTEKGDPRPLAEAAVVLR